MLASSYFHAFHNRVTTYAFLSWNRIREICLMVPFILFLTRNIFIGLMLFLLFSLYFSFALLLVGLPFSFEDSLCHKSWDSFRVIKSIWLASHWKCVKSRNNVRHKKYIYMYIKSEWKCFFFVFCFIRILWKMFDLTTWWPIPIWF